MESADPACEACHTSLLEGMSVTLEDLVAIDSSLKRLRHELYIKGASEEKQNADCKLLAGNGVPFPDHFSLEAVSVRLQNYDTIELPSIQALADVMVMRCIRPAEVTTLGISYDPQIYASGLRPIMLKASDKRTSLDNCFRWKKNPERAQELLTWTRRTIINDHLCNPGILIFK
ncbi:hypothetical protein G9A89_021102 [Geosiphon pyriformis]|nr:hypothetical protein G9A89_021102 [Geosiphon pyriformis]